MAGGPYSTWQPALTNDSLAVAHLADSWGGAARQPGAGHNGQQTGQWPGPRDDPWPGGWEIPIAQIPPQQIIQGTTFQRDPLLLGLQYMDFNCLV